MQSGATSIDNRFLHKVIADDGYDWRKRYEALMKRRAGVRRTPKA